eukprot:6929533-Ditylum_brightwellii.AAC.1
MMCRFPTPGVCMILSQPLDSAKKCTSVIDVTFPMDINMVKAAADKNKIYRDLEIAYKKEFQLRK